MASKYIAEKFYEESYKALGFGAQRKYPNEELCRFMGRNFFCIPNDTRKDIKILETGCGSGSNLWMIAKEGFDAYGIDLSKKAIELCGQMLLKYDTSANLSIQNMVQLNFTDDYFDAVVDVFSSNCLTKEDHKKYLKEIRRIIKSTGKFFSYFPSKSSDTYLYPKNAPFIDSDTLTCISREDSPFYGQNYPFRFVHPREYQQSLLDLGFTVQYLETVIKTYRMGQEKFEFVVIEASLKT